MDAAETQHYLQLLRDLGRVDGWLARIDPAADHPDPAPGSPLHADDARTHPYELSHGALLALSHAVDQLNCLRALLKDAQAIHMFAPYSLVRAALERASAAVWMLEAPGRATRVCRRLRLAADDIRNSDAAKRLAGFQGGRPKDVLIAEVRDIARRAGVAEDEAVKRVGYREVVTAAASALSPSTVVVPFAWRLCSGMTHGDPWATHTGSQLTELPGAPPGFGSFSLSVNVQILMYVTMPAVRMTSLGWRLYDQRSQPPY